MHIVVTGGAGYIGSILVPKLLDAGHKVTVLDNFLYDKNSLGQLCNNKNFNVHKVDVRDIGAMRRHLNAEVIIPLAGLVGVPLGDLNPVDAYLVNLKAKLELFQSLSRYQLVIMPTTESSYGSNADVCTEETKLNPLSTYARHKVEVENALMERGNSVSLRLATVFGMSPRMRLDLLVNDFTWRALKDRAMVIFEGQYRRTCVHVQDVARAMIHALNLPQEIYNVGACTMTKISLCEEIKKQIPDFTYIQAEISTDPDQRDYVVSDEKIRATGFIPEVDLKTGIAELIKGYRMLNNSKYANV